MRRLIFPLVLGLGCVAVLVALGLWQVRRLEWKGAILARIEAEIAAAPVPLPEAPDPEADQYLSVVVEGSYGAGEILVLVSVKGLGAGYRIVAPFQTDAGRRILIDRGFIVETAKVEARQQGRARIEGNLHWPDETDSYTPAPDPVAGIWFARDVPAMAAALGTEPVLVVTRKTSETGPDVMPLPVDTVGIPNDHLGYAVTWFGLALVWFGMTVVLFRRVLRRGN